MKSHPCAVLSTIYPLKRQLRYKQDYNLSQKKFGSVTLFWTELRIGWARPQAVLLDLSLCYNPLQCGWAVADASLKCQQDLIIAASSAHGVVKTAKFAHTCWKGSQDNKKVRRKKSLNTVTVSSFKSYTNVKQYTTHILQCAWITALTKLDIQKGFIFVLNCLDMTNPLTILVCVMKVRWKFKVRVCHFVKYAY